MSALSLFQSTLPVWGATAGAQEKANTAEAFQSTLPVWGATLWTCFHITAIVISIHAPRVGSDFSKATIRFSWSHFNPRSPCGERPALRLQDDGTAPISIHAPRVGSDCAIQDLRKYKLLFQSTLPVWGATLMM